MPHAKPAWPLLEPPGRPEHVLRRPKSYSRIHFVQPGCLLGTPESDKQSSLRLVNNAHQWGTQTLLSENTGRQAIKPPLCLSRHFAVPSHACPLSLSTIKAADNNIICAPIKIVVVSRCCCRAPWIGTWAVRPSEAFVAIQECLQLRPLSQSPTALGASYHDCVVWLWAIEILMQILQDTKPGGCWAGTENFRPRLQSEYLCSRSEVHSAGYQAMRLLCRYWEVRDMTAGWLSGQQTS